MQGRPWAMCAGCQCAREQGSHPLGANRLRSGGHAWRQSSPCSVPPLTVDHHRPLRACVVSAAQWEKTNRVRVRCAEQCRFLRAQTQALSDSGFMALTYGCTAPPGRLPPGAAGSRMPMLHRLAFESDVAPNPPSHVSILRTTPRVELPRTSVSKAAGSCSISKVGACICLSRSYNGRRKCSHVLMPEAVWGPQTVEKLCDGALRQAPQPQLLVSVDSGRRVPPHLLVRKATRNAWWWDRSSMDGRRPGGVDVPVRSRPVPSAPRVSCSVRKAVIGPRR